MRSMVEGHVPARAFLRHCTYPSTTFSGPPLRSEEEL